MESNNHKHLDILFIGKAGDFFSRQAADFIVTHYPTARIIYSTRQQLFPDDLFSWRGDVIISYLSQWIIPKKVLENARIAALNFHPGPPEYPGIGCTNFAVYNEEDTFGVTCHHMVPQVDTGQIVAVSRFPVFETDTVFSITQVCYSHILTLFYTIFPLLMRTEALPVSTEKWQRRPYLRKELDELCRLTPGMGITEIERRIRATNYIQPWAFMQVGDEVFKLTAEDVRNKHYLAYLSQPNLS